MVLLFLMTFVLLPISELYLLLKVGSWIGGWPTFLLVVTSAVVGATLARRQGRNLLLGAHAQMTEGRLPADSLLHGALVFAGGVFLLAPGFITDLFGLLLIFPPTRQWFLRRFKGFLLHRINRGQIRVQFGHVDLRGPFPDGAWRDVTATAPNPPRVSGEVIDITEARRNRESGERS